jgi:hypothetical protein
MDFFAWLNQGLQEHNAKSDVRQQDQCWLGDGKWEDGFMHYMLHYTEQPVQQQASAAAASGVL